MPFDFTFLIHFIPLASDMKIPTILSALLAASLVYAAPSAFISRPSSSSTPLAELLTRGGHSPSKTNDAVLFKSLIKYDHKTADAIIAQYNKAIAGSKSSFRTNAVTAAAAPSKDILPFCVAIGSNPTRTKIFRNKQICDGNGWTTLYVFTAHAKKDPHHAAYPACIATATKPDRSMVFPFKDSCTGNGWTTESVFYMSGKVTGDDKVSSHHESTDLWTASKPDRMMLYPYYQGNTHGWSDRPTLVTYRSRWRLSTTREMAILQAELPNHAAIHKRITIVSPPDAATHRCVQNLITTTTVKLIDANSPSIILGKNTPYFVEFATRDECPGLVATATLEAGRTTERGITSLEVSIKNKVYAAVTFRGNTATPEHYIRHTLQESLRTGGPIALAVDKEQPAQIVALVAGTIATLEPSPLSPTLFPAHRCTWFFHNN
ncbi:MAG: hypothetical protein J3R72DRAFT_509334 [Linnemannia gamsii]|nr:MAG: hypothetical protein J3R72DRAFT_509334 [Linnemannia gamsii]